MMLLFLRTHTIFWHFSACGELYYSFNRYYCIILQKFPPAAGYNALFPTYAYHILKFFRQRRALMLIFILEHIQSFKKIPPVAGYCNITNLCVEKVHPPWKFCTPSEILLWIRPCIGLSWTISITYWQRYPTAHYLQANCIGGLKYKAILPSTKQLHNFVIVTECCNDAMTKSTEIERAS